MQETNKEYDERLIAFRELQKELKTRTRMVIVEMKNGSRDVVQQAIFRAETGDMKIVTLAGYSDQWSSFHYFNNPREAQDFLFKRQTAKAA